MHKIEEVYKKLNKVLIREPGTELEQQVGYALQQTEWFPERQVWQRCCQFVLDPMVKPCCEQCSYSMLLRERVAEYTCDGCGTAAGPAVRCIHFSGVGGARPNSVQLAGLCNARRRSRPDCLAILSHAGGYAGR